LVYQSGYIISKSIGENVDTLLDRIKLKKASLIIIDGQQGEGKTTLAVGIADFVERKPCNLKDQLALGGVDFEQKLEKAIMKGYKVLIYDEAGDFSKRGALTSFNQRLNRLFETFRTFGILVIMCLPSFNVLDNGIFINGVPRMLLNCHARDRKDGAVRGYALSEMFYLKYSMKKEVNPLVSYSKITPNFRGKFHDLTPKRSYELDEISKEAKLGLLQTELALKGMYNFRDICSELGISYSYTRQVIKDLGIEPEKIHKKVKYFDAEILETLRVEVDKLRKT